MNWRLGVVGSPVAHSLSPRLHQAGLRLAGLEGSSRPVELGLEESGRLRRLLAEQYDALAVTSPLKRVAFELCDEASDVAKRAGSVNSLLARDGRILGHSTDGAGFVDSLCDAFGDVITNAYVVVLGSGGAASAILDALVDRGVGSVVVQARSESRVAELTQRYSNVRASSQVERPVDLVVNTLPVAARPSESAVLAGVHPGTVAVDLAYEPRDSAWRQHYRDAGCRTLNGLPMLAYQAAFQMGWWWGVTLKGAQLLEVLD